MRKGQERMADRGMYPSEDIVRLSFGAACLKTVLNALDIALLALSCCCCCCCCCSLLVVLIAIGLIGLGIIMGQ